jgi:hypothetical protein
MGSAAFRGVHPDAAAVVFPPTGKINSNTRFSMLSAIPRAITTAGRFPGRHNWRQISRLPDGQMALYGIAAPLSSDSVR